MMIEHEQAWFRALAGLVSTAIAARRQQASARDYLQFERLLRSAEEEMQELQQIRSARLEQPTSIAFLHPSKAWQQIWMDGVANNLHNLAFLLHGELAARIASQGKLLQAYADVHMLLEEAYLRITDPTPLQLAVQPQDGMPVDEVRAMLFGNMAR